MQPAWTNADLIPYVCRHITDVHQPAALSTVSRAFNNYLFSTTGGKHWVRAGKLVCGEDYWPQDAESLHLEQTDPRYLTKIRICPWISVPIEVVGAERDLIENTEIPESGDEGIVKRLNGTRWAPNIGNHYGTIENIIKLHDSVSIVTSAQDADEDAIFAYFISSKTHRLLADRFHIMKPGYSESWSVTNGNLYMRFQESNDGAEQMLRFGLRPDKSIRLPNQKAAIIQAFWSAFRGDMVGALRQLTEGGIEHLASIKCHDQSLAQHVINGGSLKALKTLLEAHPCCSVNERTVVYALRNHREDMAELILLNTVPHHPFSSGKIWFCLTDNDEESMRELDQTRAGIDFNLVCACYWRVWRKCESSTPMPPFLTPMLITCAKLRIPTSDGKQFVDIMREYTTQLMANYDDDEDDEDGSVSLLRYKVQSVMEILTAHD